MKSLFLIMAVLGMTGTSVNIAADPAAGGGVEPGRWQLVMEMQLSDKGWAPRPFSLSQCLTWADAQDPSRMLSGMISPGVSGCHYVRKDYSGSTFSFTLQCTGSYGIVATGKVKFDGTHFSGTMSESVNTGDKTPTRFRSRISGKRLGGCQS